MCAAAETMIELFGRAHGKTWGFFIMERAAGRVIRTCFFERHAFINHINDVDTVE